MTALTGQRRLTPGRAEAWPRTAQRARCIGVGIAVGAAGIAIALALPGAPRTRGDG